MFDLDKYLADLIMNCRSAFGDRLLYVGLQGSWLRGEAHENSDIDVMVILDRLSVRDMDTYRGILKEIGFYEKSCGFICGKDEMKRWNPLEVCQLRHSTKDLIGVLTDYLPPATREDEINYVKLSLGNLYHELCHRYIHADRDKDTAKFRGTCKSVFYLIQNLHFLESGHFILSRKDLKKAVTEEDRIVLEMAELPDGYDFDQAFTSLFAWCQRAFVRIERFEMNQYIACCGLDCESCEARLATVNNDDTLRKKVAKLWSDLNGVEITPEMINCVGCRIDGVKTPYCESLCPIRQCAMGKGLETCGGCGEMEHCEKLGAITGNNADALKRLKTGI